MQGYAVPQATTEMMEAQQTNYNEMESEETVRYNEHAFDNGGKRFPPQIGGGAINRVQLAQIENAIDTLLAQ